MIAVISVLVLGPKQLPDTMRTMAKIVRRVRSLGAEFQGHMNDMLRQAELDELRDQVQKISTTNVTAEVTKLVDPGGELGAALRGESAPPLDAAEVAPAETSALPEPPADPPPAAPPPAAPPAEPPAIEPEPSAPASSTPGSSP